MDLDTVATDEKTAKDGSVVLWERPVASPDNIAVDEGDRVDEAPGQLVGLPGAILHQSTNQWYGCICCFPNMNYTVHPYQVTRVSTDALDGERCVWQANWNSDFWKPDHYMGDRSLDNLPARFTILEDAPAHGRFFSKWCAGFRKTSYSVWAVEERGLLYTHKKGWTCPNYYTPLACIPCPPCLRCLGIPICCSLPYLETYNAAGDLVGRAEYTCDSWYSWLVPKYEVRDAAGRELFTVRGDTAGGCCLKCSIGSYVSNFLKLIFLSDQRCYRVPFYIRESETLTKLAAVPTDESKENLATDAHILNKYGHVWDELFTKRDTYAVKFPEGEDGAPIAGEDARQTLIGVGILMEMTLNE